MIDYKDSYVVVINFDKTVVILPWFKYRPHQGDYIVRFGTKENAQVCYDYYCQLFDKEVK